MQPYKASTWDSIPDWAKDPDGKWTISYLGTMSSLQNIGQYRRASITTWQELADSDCLVTIGDVVRGASSQMAVLSCAYALGGGIDNIDPAIEFFKGLAEEGRLDAGGLQPGENGQRRSGSVPSLGLSDLTVPRPGK